MLLDIMLRRAQAVDRLLAEIPEVERHTQTRVGYLDQTPTPKQMAAGLYNCSSFMAWSIGRCEIDLRQRLEVGGVQASLDAFINIRTEDDRADDYVLARGFDLAALIAAGDRRLGGVAVALVAAGLAAYVTDPLLLRPGDLLQSWKPNNRGHSEAIAELYGVDERDQELHIDHRTRPRAVQLTRADLGTLGSHFPAGSVAEPIVQDGRRLAFRRGRSIYTKSRGDIQSWLESKAMWVAARPFTSPWHELPRG